MDILGAVDHIFEKVWKVFKLSNQSLYVYLNLAFYK